MGGFDWSYISALLSVAFGWFLNELSQWLGTRQADRKIKKHVLFNLLEIQFMFNKLDISEITELISQKVLARISKSEQTKEAKQFINQLYNRIISDLVEENVEESLKETEVHYTKSINELSKLAPITAYRLKGKNKLILLFDLLQDYLDRVKVAFTSEPGLNDQIDVSVKTIKPELIKEAISDLEVEIKSIALSINLRTWYRAKKTLNNMKIKVQKDDEKKIDDLLNKLMP
jgi:hypothetical protein